MTIKLFISGIYLYIGLSGIFWSYRSCEILFDQSWGTMCDDQSIDYKRKDKNGIYWAKIVKNPNHEYGRPMQTVS